MIFHWPPTENQWKNWGKVKFYGDYANPDSLRQMSFFGDSLGTLEKKLYVECNPYGAYPKVEECRRKLITTYPTWIVDGVQYKGITGLNKLSQLTGCDYGN